jgi:chorismate mutase
MEENKISLEEVRQKLARIEDNILFSLIGRSEFKTNNLMYIPGGVEVPDFNGSFFDFLFSGTEKLHSMAGRYLDRTEHPFYDNPLPGIARRRVEPCPLPREIEINKNSQIKTIYLNQVQSFCIPGDDNQYGAAALWDIRCLQDLSRRIHFGMFVAESKYQQDSEGYRKLAEQKDVAGIISKLRNVQVEQQILDRLKVKGERYGFNPTKIHDFYKNFVIPLTIDLEVEYLFKRVKI